MGERRKLLLTLLASLICLRVGENVLKYCTVFINMARKGKVTKSVLGVLSSLELMITSNIKGNAVGTSALKPAV